MAEGGNLYSYFSFKTETI